MKRMNQKMKKVIVFLSISILLLFINYDKTYDKHMLLIPNEIEISFGRRK